MRAIFTIIILSLLTSVLSVEVMAGSATLQNSAVVQQKATLSGDASAGGEIIPGQYIVVLKSSKSRIPKVQPLATVLNEVTAIAESVDARTTHVYGSALQGFSGKLTAEQVKDLRNDPKVSFVEPDRTAKLLAQTVPWGLTHIKAPMAHAAGITGKKVKVGVIDTGIDYLHPDLEKNYLGGFDFFDNDADPMDERGHGTHVSGTIAAFDNGFGVIGVAPNVELYGIKVFGAVGGTEFSTIVAGIDWAVANGMDVINLSLGGRFGTQALHTACDNAFASGVVICAAAGNEFMGQVLFPAAYSSCIAVSAIDDANNLAFFSSRGPQVEVTAPGVNILSTIPGNQYARFMGTSMATPHVTGVVALMWSTGNFTSAAEVRAQLTATATDIGFPGRDINFGFGLVDVNAAIGGIGKTVSPTARFSEIRKSGCRPLNVQFTDESIGEVTSWLWDFGDGTTSTLQNPTHWYFADGLYTVTLQASNSSGSTQITKTDLVSVNHFLCSQPFADFSATPRVGCGELSVSFTDLSPGTLLSHWDFGDGTTVQGKNPTHKYTAPGFYTVTLTVFNFVGRDAETKLQYIEVKPPLTPAFTSDVQTGSAPLTVTFANNTAGNVTGWNWDFGDGKSSIEQNPVHTYTKTGAYTVTLTAFSDTCGTQEKIERSFIVVGDCISAPVANFSASTSSGTAPLSVSFSDLSSGNPHTWLWSFGDGDKSGLQDPVHTYTSAGVFRVQLRVENSCGKDRITKDGFIVVTESGAGGLSVSGTTPLTFALKPNYPNPFNPSTTISFSLPEASRVSLEIFNITGQRIVSLIDSRLEAGEHSVEWQASNHASGVYFYRLTTDKNNVTRKMMLIK